MAVVDENAAALGISRKQLMESSGHAVARTLQDIAAPGESIAVIAGRGNNGGDGFVAARFLDNYDVTVHLLGRSETISTDIARENWVTLEQALVETDEVRDSNDLNIGEPSVIVDAMLGTGVSGDLREPEATAARRINEADATVVAVDVPSGVNPDTGTAVSGAVDADRVVTFHDIKPGLVDLPADVTVADIGIPTAAELFVDRGDLRLLSRDPQSHKGDFGEVLVVGGGPYTGAPALTAQAALRAGADLVRVLCPESIARQVQGYSEDLIVETYPGDRFTPDHVDRVRSAAAVHDVVVFGPGLGDREDTLEAAADLLSAFEGPIVVDADALQVVPKIETAATLICTPHQGELQKMGGESDPDWEVRADLVEGFAAELGQVLLVKGAYDIISDGERTRVSRTGNPGMTVGGTGDVLAGVCGALACTVAPHDAAAVGAYANGQAGDFVVDEYGYGLLASDLLHALPRVLWGDDT